MKGDAVESKKKGTAQDSGSCSRRCNEMGEKGCNEMGGRER